MLLFCEVTKKLISKPTNPQPMCIALHQFTLIINTLFHCRESDPLIEMQRVKVTELGLSTQPVSLWEILCIQSMDSHMTGLGFTRATSSGSSDGGLKSSQDKKSPLIYSCNIQSMTSRRLDTGHNSPHTDLL